MTDTLEILRNELGNAVMDSSKMIFIAMIISIIVGGVLGLILYLTSNKMFFENKSINSISGFIINVISL